MRNVFLFFSMFLFVTSAVYAYPVNDGTDGAYIIKQIAQAPAYNIQVRPAPPPPPRRDVDRRPAPPPPRRDADMRPAPPAPRREPAYNIQVRPAPPPPPPPAYNIQVRPAPPPPPRR